MSVPHANRILSRSLHEELQSDMLINDTGFKGTKMMLSLGDRKSSHHNEFFSIFILN